MMKSIITFTIIFIVAALSLSVTGCNKPSEHQIKACEAHASYALEVERSRMKSIPKALLTADSTVSDIMSQEYNDRHLRLVDDIYSRKLGDSMDEIHSNVMKSCLKTPLKTLAR